MSDNAEQPQEKSWSVIPAGKEHDPFYYVPPYDATVELQPNYFCRARNTKREKYCRAKAGQGTDHLAQGRCRNHGGATPITHGRYSDVLRGSVGEHLDRLTLETEKEQLDVLPEAQMLRAIVLSVGEKWEKFFEGITSYNDDEAREARAEERRPKFLAVPELADLADLAKKTAEIVNMVHKQRSSNAISLPDFHRLMAAMAGITATLLEKYFKNRVPQDVIDSFTTDLAKEWQTIKLKA